jgi:glycosyltransferase involved in cell wall biosynthesis
VGTVPHTGSQAPVRLTFVIPRNDNALSAATIYRRGMVNALRAAGHQVDIVTTPPPAGGRLVIDAVTLETSATTLPVASDTTILVHHLPKQPGTHAAWRSAPRIVTTSRPTTDHLVEKFGIDPSRVAIIPPGIEDFPRNSNGAKTACAILSVGALIERKAHGVLLRALARLPDLEWSLAIVGSITADPAHAAVIGELVDTLGIGHRVHIHANPDAAALENLWREADLFALASCCEGFAMQAAIALRRGIPAVVSNGGAAGELVPPEAGAVCPAGEDVAFSKALRRLIFDRDLRRMLADGAFEAGRKLPVWAEQAALFVEALP